MGASWADGKNEASPAEAGEYRGLRVTGEERSQQVKDRVSPHLLRCRRIEE